MRQAGFVRPPARDGFAGARDKAPRDMVVHVVADVYCRPLMARSSKAGSSSSDASAPQSGESSGIDGILAGLEAVVRDLESGDLPLERALERFEEGVRLARRGGQLLDAIEERVEMLLADRDETVPFEPNASSTEENP